MTPSSDPSTVLPRFLEGPALLRDAIAGLSDADLDAVPAAGGWSIREIVHHVVDGDDIWKIGVKAALGNVEGEFTFDWYREMSQKDWAERWGYARRSIDVSLALFDAIRAHVAHLLEEVPGGWTRSIGLRKADGGVERVTVGFLVEMQADHVVHHVKRILAIRRELGVDS